MQTIKTTTKTKTASRSRSKAPEAGQTTISPTGGASKSRQPSGIGKNGAGPSRTISAFAGEQIRSIKPGEVLVLVQGLSNLLTTGFSLDLEDGRVSANTREGVAEAMLMLRSGDNVVAFPVTFSAYFDWMPHAGWACEMPLGHGVVQDAPFTLEPLWTNVIPWEGLTLRVRLDTPVVAMLDTAEVITPGGENLGVSLPPRIAMEKAMALRETRVPESRSSRVQTSKRA